MEPLPIAGARKHFTYKGAAFSSSFYFEIFHSLITLGDIHLALRLRLDITTVIAYLFEIPHAVAVRLDAGFPSPTGTHTHQPGNARTVHGAMNARFECALNSNQRTPPRPGRTNGRDTINGNRRERELRLSGTLAIPTVHSDANTVMIVI